MMKYVYLNAKNMYYTVCVLKSEILLNCERIHVCMIHQTPCTPIPPDINTAPALASQVRVVSGRLAPFCHGKSRTETNTMTLEPTESLINIYIYKGTYLST